MASREAKRRLRQGTQAWNAWRKTIGRDRAQLNLRNVIVEDGDLQRANLSFARLGGARLLGVNLSRANLKHVVIDSASIIDVDLTNASLIGADLGVSTFRNSNLSGANLRNADLSLCTFSGVSLRGANLTEAALWDTAFLDVDLTGAIGLDECKHHGPSSIDFRSLKKSGLLPQTFLRGVGLSDSFIDYLPSLLEQPIQHYSSFISYSSADKNFADRLYADLQNKGVRCWFAPHDMQIGDKIWDTIDQAIRLRDKVILILSEHSIRSDWVEDEVTKAFEEERRRGQPVLFPLRLDDATMDTNEAWAVKLRGQRHIGDFRRWKEHDAYAESFERVLRDLTMKKS